MAFYKNVASQKIAVYAYDTANNTSKTGDAANITAQISKDGAATAATNDTNPTELDATDAPGVYLFDMTQAETNADLVILFAKSSSADIVLEPVFIYTTPGDNAALTANVTEIGGDTQSATDLKDFADAGYDPATNKVQGVVLVDTCTANSDMRGTDSALLASSAPANFGDLAITATTGRVTVGTNNDKTGYSLTNLTVQASTTLVSGSHNPQSGDAYAYLGTNLGLLGANATEAGGTGDQFTAVAQASSWTPTRAGYLDNLNVGGNVASSAEVTAIQNNTRVVRSVPVIIERPDSGTATYRIELLSYDATGNMEAPDSAPTVDLVDQGGTDLSSRLDSATGTLVSTGRYRWIYTASDTDELEQLNWTFSVVEGSATRLYTNTTLIVDTTAVDFTSADRTKLDAIFTDTDSTLPGFLASILGDTNELQTEWANGGRLDMLIDAIKAVTDAIPDSGAMTSIAQEATVAALNDLSTADISSALATYDGPTKAELDAGFAALNDPSAAAVATSVWAAGTRTLTAGTNLSFSTFDPTTDEIESGVTYLQGLRAVCAALAGILTGADGSTITIKAIGAGSGGTTRITATVDANGNRSAITLNL